MVFGFKSETFASTDTGFVPEPADCRAVVLLNTAPKSESVLYSNQYVVSSPLGFTRPFSVAVDVETPLADLVSAVGAPGEAGPLVVKLCVAPLTVPY